jgi:hypothetical protein
MAVWFAASTGAEVVAVGRNDHLAVATELGAARAVDATDPEAFDAIADSADAVITFAPSDAVTEQALRTLRARPPRRRAALARGRGERDRLTDSEVEDDPGASGSAALAVVTPEAWSVPGWPVKLAQLRRSGAGPPAGRSRAGHRLRGTA